MPQPKLDARVGLLKCDLGSFEHDAAGQTLLGRQGGASKEREVAHNTSLDGNVDSLGESRASGCLDDEGVGPRREPHVVAPEGGVGVGEALVQREIALSTLINVNSIDIEINK